MKHLVILDQVKINRFKLANPIIKRGIISNRIVTVPDFLVHLVELFPG